jgi:hypothetical protein
MVRVFSHRFYGKARARVPISLRSRGHCQVIDEERPPFLPDVPGEQAARCK